MGAVQKLGKVGFRRFSYFTLTFAEDKSTISGLIKPSFEQVLLAETANARGWRTFQRGKSLLF